MRPRYLRSLPLMLIIFLILLYPAAYAKTVRILDGTEVQLRVNRTLVSGQAQVNELVPFTVVADVLTSTGEIGIPRGSRAVGHVLVSSGRGIFGKPGKLDFTVDSVTAVNGVSYPLRATQQLKGQSNSAASIGVSLLLFWPALFINGRDITVQEGSEFRAWLNGDAVIEIPDPVSTTSSAAVSTVPAQPLAQVPQMLVTSKDAEMLALWIRTTAEDSLIAKGFTGTPRVGIAKFTMLNVSALDAADVLSRELGIAISKFGLISVNTVDLEIAKAGIRDAALIDSATAVAVSKQAGCDLLLVGTVMSFGSQSSISARLIDSSNGIVLSSQRYELGQSR